jgi:N-acetylneuraminic acid mutarotase
MNKKQTTQSAFFNLRILITLVLCAVAACSLVNRPVLAFFRPEASTKDSQRTLTFAQRVAYQRAFEEVYWRHRIWPKENPDPKPSLDAVMSQTQLEKKVSDYLRSSQALQDYWQQPITPEQLQAEMDRMAQHTKQPAVLREVFAALGNDPFVIAECLARPVLTDRLITDLSAQDKGTRFGATRTEKLRTDLMTAPEHVAYTLPNVPEGDPSCTDDTWTPTSLINAPHNRDHHTAVWTGSEMIVWGGIGFPVYSNTGASYNPSTDSWTATSTTNAPDARDGHTGIWTGSEMIVWGGTGNSFFNTGGRYNPSTDSWTATSTTNAPDARDGHTAVWTGSEMIVWGGYDGRNPNLNSGGRYNPRTDSWTSTSTTNAPAAREKHTAVWTGNEMIVWGGFSISYWNTGGRYNPNSDSWVATSITNAPEGRFEHTAVWTGSDMIVWGGDNNTSTFNSGGRYSPASNTWAATSITNAPSARSDHTAIWAANEMIVWGGHKGGSGPDNTGGRYNLNTDSWTATSTTSAPTPRWFHTAVWTGTEMIVWGGTDDGALASGGRYCAQSSAPAVLGNISTRSFVQTGQNVMIGGFIVQGTGTKSVIIRAIGPELTQYGITDALANPTLQLYNSTGTLLCSNDNWQTTIIGGIITSSQVSEIQNSGHVPTNASESAMIANLAPGNYTAIVSGVDHTTGVALAEAYDLNPDTTSVLGNISTRSFVETGEHVMIGGFIVQGSGTKRVIIRAIGPELGAPPYNLPDTLANPTLQLHNAAGALIGSNDNWQTTIIGGIITSSQVSDIQSSGHAPTNASESAIIANLAPGSYTAIVSGVGNTTGVALVEVYDLD